MQIVADYIDGIGSGRIVACEHVRNAVARYENDRGHWAFNEDLVSKIFATDTCHWRTTPSTCGSFIISKKLWKEDYSFHVSIEGDHNKWIALNQEKERFILSPLPGLSTHCMETLLTPTIDWKKINN